MIVRACDVDSISFLGGSGDQNLRSGRHFEVEEVKSILRQKGYFLRVSPLSRWHGPNKVFPFNAQNGFLLKHFFVVYTSNYARTSVTVMSPALSLAFFSSLPRMISTSFRVAVLNASLSVLYVA